MNYLSQALPNQLAPTPPVIRTGRVTEDEGTASGEREVTVDGLNYDAPIAGDYPGQGSVTVFQMGSQVAIVGPGAFETPEPV